MQNAKIKIIIGAPVGCSSFKIGCVFVKYDLFNSYTKSDIYTFWYNSQFYINFSRQEHQINVLYVSFNAWDSQVSAYILFHFSFTVPLIFLDIINGNVKAQKTFRFSSHFYWVALSILCKYIPWEPENSVVWRRLLDSSYDYR